jgi:hypothetical protein
MSNLRIDDGFGLLADILVVFSGSYSEKVQNLARHVIGEIRTGNYDTTTDYFRLLDKTFYDEVGVSIFSSLGEVKRKEWKYVLEE